MKILHVISSVNPEGGGPIEGVKQFGRVLTDAGHRVEIASLDPVNAPFMDQCPLPVHALGPGKSSYGYTGRFTSWLKENKGHYDAVVVNGIWQYHSFGAWRVLCQSSTPYVVFPHGMLDPWFKKRYPLKHLKKWLYWPWADYRVLRDAYAVLFTCEEERVLARQSFWLYGGNEVVVSYGTAKPNGDPEMEIREFFLRYPRLRDRKLALFMGRIHPKKGCDILIEAFGRIFRQQSNWHLVIAGPDQVGWRSELDERAARLGLGSRVTWTGMIDGAMKWGALRAAEVFVLPSHQENFGIAVAESLAVGVPALVSNKVNIWREIERDKAGMAAEDTLEGTCIVLQSYVDLTEAAKRAMRRAATECFGRRFEIGKAAQNLCSVLSAAVANQGAPRNGISTSQITVSQPIRHLSTGELTVSRQVLDAAGAGSYSVRITTTAAGIDALRSIWTRWADSPEANIDYFLHNIAHDPTVLGPYVITINHNGVPCSLLFGQVRERRVSSVIAFVNVPGPRARVLEIKKGSRIGQVSPAIDRLLALELLNFARSGAVDSIWFDRLPLQSELFRKIQQASGFVVRCRVPHVFHYSVLLNGESKPSVFQGKMRREIRRKTRILERAYPGCVEVKCFARPTQVNDAISEAVHVAMSTWQHALGLGLTDTPQTRERFRFFAAQGWLRIYILYVKESPRAFLVGQLYKDTFYCQYAGYDPDLTRFSVGCVLTARVFEELAACGVRRVDLGEGGQEHNRRLGCQVSEEGTVHVYSPTLRGLIVNLFFGVAYVVRKIGSNARTALKLGGLNSMRHHYRNPTRR
jgi:glycosyltransferase involved in cell wall biosynthesis